MEAAKLERTLMHVSPRALVEHLRTARAAIHRMTALDGMALGAYQTADTYLICAIAEIRSTLAE
jgi:hypothetical protein